MQDMSTIKRIKMKFGLVLFAIVMCNQAEAKEKVIGAYDSLAVMNDTAVWASYNQALQKFRAMGEAVISDMQKQQDADMEKYFATKDTMSEVNQKLYEKKIEENRQIIEYKRAALAEDYEILQVRLRLPVFTSIRDAIIILKKRHKLSELVSYHSLSYRDKITAIDFTDALISEVIILEKIRNSG